MFRFIKQFAFPYWIYYLFGLVALIITNYIATLIPLIVRDIIDYITQGGADFSVIRPLLLSIIGLAVVLMVARSFSRILIFFPGRSMEYDLRKLLFSKLLSLSPKFYRQQKIGDLMSRMINDIQSLRATTAMGYLHISNTSMIYIIVFFQMARINLLLTLIVILPIPIMMLSIQFFVKKMFKHIRACQEYLGDLSNFFVETLSQITLIKSYAAESAIMSQFGKKNTTYFNENLRLAKVRSSMFPFIGIIGNIGQFLLLLVGAGYIIKSTLSIGEFVAMSTYIALLSSPTSSMAWIINIIQRGRSSWARIEEILDTPSDFSGQKHLTQSSAGYSLELRNFSFSYDSTAIKPVLDNISLTINPGEKIGFFGTTASGKSTLLQILAGLEQVEHFYVNKEQFSTLDVSDYRKQVSYVGQQAFLFSVSIGENISFLRNNLDEQDQAQIELAAKKACVLSDIHQFTQNFDTLVGEKGVILSGGQKSRLALARAFYKPSKLMILDDVLAPVDHETEKAIIHELFTNKPSQQTVILSSHRISALTHCDRIYVLEKGKISCFGSHEDLLQLSELYKNTYDYQQMMDSK
jgi:ATP-binding cassette subfamily B multidrug efflux pump